MLLVIWASGSLIFFLTRLTGEDALESRFRVDTARLSRMSEVQRQAALKFREGFAYDRPLWRQYLLYLGRLARFDLGYSMTFYPVTVNQVLMDSAFWTIGLLTVTTVIAFAAGTILGGLLAWPGMSGLFKFALLPMMLVSAVPQYVLGLLIVLGLAYHLQWFPLFGGYTIGAFPEVSAGFAFDVLRHSVLPALTIIASATGFWALSMRGMMVTVLEADFMTLGQAKGLTRARLFFRYALRNSLLPQATGLAVSLGTVLSGVVLVEIVFSYPGLGDALFRAVRRYDYFVVSGLVYVMAVSLAVATFAIDVLYLRLDPRVRQEM